MITIIIMRESGFFVEDRSMTSATEPTDVVMMWCGDAASRTGVPDRTLAVIVDSIVIGRKFHASFLGQSLMAL